MTIDLDELERLEREATAGPWHVYDDDELIGPNKISVVSASIDDHGYFGEAGDAAFVAALRNAAPALIARARRADELEAGNAWRPIETAPKDGTVIWATNGDDQFECWWETAREWPQSTEGFNNWSKGHLTAAGCDAGFDQAYPTHWRKRPNDPLKTARN
jgi:hypothetical protein